MGIHNKKVRTFLDRHFDAAKIQQKAIVRDVLIAHRNDVAAYLLPQGTVPKPQDQARAGRIIEAHLLKTFAGKLDKYREGVENSLVTQAEAASLDTANSAVYFQSLEVLYNKELEKVLNEAVEVLKDKLQAKLKENRLKIHHYIKTQSHMVAIHNANPRRGFIKSISDKALTTIDCTANLSDIAIKAAVDNAFFVQLVEELDNSLAEYREEIIGQSRTTPSATPVHEKVANLNALRATLHGGSAKPQERLQNLLRFLNSTIGREVNQSIWSVAPAATGSPAQPSPNVSWLAKLFAALFRIKVETPAPAPQASAPVVSVKEQTKAEVGLLSTLGACRSFAPPVPSPRPSISVA